MVFTENLPLCNYTIKKELSLINGEHNGNSISLSLVGSQKARKALQYNTEKSQKSFTLQVFYLVDQENVSRVETQTLNWKRFSEFNSTVLINYVNLKTAIFTAASANTLECYTHNH